MAGLLAHQDLQALLMDRGFCLLAAVLEMAALVEPDQERLERVAALAVRGQMAVEAAQEDIQATAEMEVLPTFLEQMVQAVVVAVVAGSVVRMLAVEVVSEF
jgi:hypothetical protein